MIGASYLSQLVFREKNCLPIINALICILVYFLAFFVRLFAVIRFESVIHEFDPYFNFRTTKFLVEKGK
jgi:dolichyl-diphosphooligosaccharide---protein glycosyltransferase